MVLDHKVIELHGKMLLEKAVLKPPFTMPNFMSGEACFFYVIEGVNQAIGPTSTEVIKSKESVLMKCGNYFGNSLPTDDEVNYHAVAVHFYPEVLKKVYDNELPNFFKEPKKLSTTNGMARIDVDSLFQRYVDGILYYFENPQLATEELLTLKVKELILLLSNTKNAPAVQEILSNLFSPQKVKLKDVVRAHLYHDVSLDQLAQLANLSLSSFKREFKEVFNDSPASYLKNKKLEKAASLLKVGDESISNIAFDCGFNDLAHFSKVFKTKFGVSPSRYRTI